MRSEEWVCFADFGPNGTLDGGFDFGLCACGDTGKVLSAKLRVHFEGILHLLFLEHV